MMMSEINKGQYEDYQVSDGLREQVLELNYTDRKLFLNHKQFSVVKLLTHFENST